MSDAAQRAVAQGKEGVFWKTFRKRIEWAIVGGLICALIGGYYWWYGNILLAGVFIAASPFIVFIDSFTQYSALLLGRQEFRRNTLYSVIIQIGAGLIIFFTILFSRNLVVIVTGYLAAFVLMRGFSFWHTTKMFPPDPTEHDETAVNYGAHMSVTNVVNITISQLDALFLWHFLGPVPLAIYAFAEAAADQAQKGFKLVTTAIAFPKFSAMNKEVIKKTLPRKILLAHAVTFPLAVLLALIIPYVYRFVFPLYTDSIPYAQVLALLLTFTPLRLISTAINAKASIKMIYQLSVVGSVLYFAMVLIAVPFYGIWGLIIGTFLEESVMNIYSYFWLFRKM
jgi:O-antigen/teichoic acid export membrane protein